MPGSVKVARMFVTHLVLVRVQVRQPFAVAFVAQLSERGSSKSVDAGGSPAESTNYQGVMSAVNGLVRNEEVESATLSALTIACAVG
jgi:hypothetical protein